jgi:hypothetical protein
MVTTAQPDARNGNRDGKWRGVLLAGGAGTGLALTYAAVELMRSEPKAFADAVIRAFLQWGPMFILCLVGMFIVNNVGQKLLEHSAAHAAAQQRMADAMQQIASRDDQASRERELLLNDVAFVLKEVKTQVSAIREDQIAAPHVRSVAAGQGG